MGVGKLCFRVFGFLILSLAVVQVRDAQADILGYYARKATQIRDSERARRAIGLTYDIAMSRSKKGEILQKLNYGNRLDKRKFKQRYFWNSEFAEGPASPVLLMICGEAACDESELGGMAAVHAKSLKAHLFALEHRYYGESQPFTFLSSSNLRYLRTDFALQDIAAFQDFAKSQFKLSGKWITIGGSYAGSLSAYFRSRYPERVIGALASSGPVEAKAEFLEYDAQVGEVAGPVCAAAIRDAVRSIESEMLTAEGKDRVKALFGAQEIREDVDFLYVVADMAAFAVQYGWKDDFCHSLTTEPNRVAAYGKIGQEILDRFGIRPVDGSFQGAESLSAKDYEKGVGLRQWLWQSCTEYGYYQVAHPDPLKTTRSARIDLGYHNEMCRRLFGLKKSVDVSRINAKFLQPLFEKRTSDILFTNGSTDPWAKLSISAERNNDKNALTRAFTIPGAAHCDDLGMRSSLGINRAKALFVDLAKRWSQ